MQPLNIFVPHCSDLLTDHRPHGDGLVANGFLRHIARRGHHLYVAAERVDVLEPFPGNVHITELNPAGRKGLGVRLRYLHEMRRLFRQQRRTVRFDLVHQLNPVFTGMSLALPGDRTPLVLGPYVANWPDNPDAAHASPGPARGVIAAARTLLARLQQSQASALLLTTPAAVDRIPQHAELNARMHLLPHGLDTNLFVPPSHAPVSKTLDILFLSNVSRRKGIFDLLQAFEAIAAEFPSARLQIAGDGPELGEAQAMAERMSCRDAIHFLGRQTRAGSLSLLQQCTLFCQPSLGEPFGMSAAEAMGCGKPLVITAAGGLQYLIDDAGGMRVPVGSPEPLAHAIRALLSDPSLRASMGAHNQRRAVEWLAWDRVIDRLEQIYVELLPQT